MKNSIFLLSGIVFMTLLICSSCEEQIKYERPVDNWAFRSVMDKQPRMLTLALNQDLYVCYNLQSGNLYKAWKGGVNYDGAVYTTAHGIQPSSYGYVYMQDDSEQTQWELRTKDGIEIPKINFLGYSMLKGQIGIDFELISKSGESVKVREIPEYDFKEDRSGFSRQFTILKGSNKDLAPILNYNLNAGAVHSEVVIGGGARESGSNRLIINGKTNISTYFNPVPKDWKEPITDNTGRIAVGMELAEQSDCKACHMKHENLVGPAYDSIAKRYPFDWSTVDLLASRIRRVLLQKVFLSVTLH